MCPSCSGRMKILTTLVKPGSVRAYLDGVGLPSRAPPIAPSRLDRQLEFDEPTCSLRRVSADTPVPTRHAIAATRPLQHVVGMILPSPRAIDWRPASHSACQAGTRLTIMAPYRAYPPSVGFHVFGSGKMVPEILQSGTRILIVICSESGCYEIRTEPTNQNQWSCNAEYCRSAER